MWFLVSVKTGKAGHSGRIPRAGIHRTNWVITVWTAQYPGLVLAQLSWRGHRKRLTDLGSLPAKWHQPALQPCRA